MHIANLDPGQAKDFEERNKLRDPVCQIIEINTLYGLVPKIAENSSWPHLHISKLLPGLREYEYGLWPTAITSRKSQVMFPKRGHCTVSQFRQNWEIIFRSVTPYFIGHILFGKFYPRINGKQGLRDYYCTTFQARRRTRRKKKEIPHMTKKILRSPKTPSTLRSSMHIYFAKPARILFSCFYSEKFQKRHETFERIA